jgi:hypothetical protein
MTSMQPQQDFEWIPHGDVSARKRARAHVTRGFRRAKAVEAQNAEKLKSISEPPRSRSSSLEEEKPITILAHRTLIEPQIEPVTSTTAKKVIEELVLQRTLGSGRADPFATYPVKLTPKTHELLDHCKQNNMHQYRSCS